MGQRKRMSQHSHIRMSLIPTEVQELSIDYTHCNDSSISDQPSDIPHKYVSHSFKSSNFTRPQWSITTDSRKPPYSTVNITKTRICTLQFNIPNDIGPHVYLYYKLTNFYQNHRRYVKSLDTDQLKGNAKSNSTIDGSSCDPLELDHNGKAYYPCGLIANSIFNDTIFSPVAVNPPGSDEPRPFVMTNQSIAWNSDASLYKKTHYKPIQVSPPPNWHERFPDGYGDEIPDLSKYEEFHVWMRTAGLPTFSKLALRNDDDIMKAGTYTIDIYDCKLIESCPWRG